MKKNIFILVIIIIVLAVVGGGFYLWWQNQPQNYIVVKRTAEGQLVVNQKEGVLMIVPEGWIIQRPTSKQEPIMLWDPTQMKCKIESSVEKLNISIDDLQKKLFQPSDDPILSKSETFRESKIITFSNNQKAVQEDVITEQFGFVRTLWVQLNSKKYLVLSIMPHSDQQKDFCLEEFEKVINSMVLK